jgi:hypothetical protein
MSINTCVLMTISLVALPWTGVLAQQNNPIGNQGSNNSATATADTAGSPSPQAPVRVGNSGTPGGTGSTIVPGNMSTVGSDGKATMDQKLGTPNR